MGRKWLTVQIFCSYINFNLSTNLDNRDTKKMLVHDRKIPIKRQKLVNIDFIRNLFCMLIIFNICNFAHAKVTSKSAATPISKSQLINNMVVHQFVGSLVLVGGLCLLTPTSKE